MGDPVSDAKLLRKAMKGVGTDEKTLIHIICNRSREQLVQIEASFKQQFSHDLRKDIKSETSGNFRQILLKRFDPPFLQKAKALHKAMKGAGTNDGRSEEHTSELQSLMRISYAVFCLKKKHKNT